MEAGGRRRLFGARVVVVASAAKGRTRRRVMLPLGRGLWLPLTAAVAPGEKPCCGDAWGRSLRPEGENTSSEEVVGFCIGGADLCGRGVNLVFGVSFLVMEVVVLLEVCNLYRKVHVGTTIRLLLCQVGFVSVSCSLDLLPLFLTLWWRAISCKSKFFCLAVYRTALPVKILRCEALRQGKRSDTACC